MTVGVLLPKSLLDAFMEYPHIDNKPDGHAQTPAFFWSVVNQRQVEVLSFVLGASTCIIVHKVQNLKE